MSTMMEASHVVQSAAEAVVARARRRRPMTLTGTEKEEEESEGGLESGNEDGLEI